MNQTATNTEQWLIEQMQNMPVIDGHEHLPREQVRLQEHTDAFTFFRQYTRLVMFSAGLDEKTFLQMHDPDLPLDERFRIFEPYRDLIRFSGPARAAYIALERFYGEKELTRDNWASITDKMRKLYRPGLYKNVLQDGCGIEKVLQNAPAEELDYDDSLMMPVPSIWEEWGDFQIFADTILSGQFQYADPDEYLEAQPERLRLLADRGAAGFKFRCALHTPPNRRAAMEVYNRLRQGDHDAARTDVPNPLQNYVLDRLIAQAGQFGRPMVVHTGASLLITLGVRGDLRQEDCREFIPYLIRYPDIRFDLFHMGMPDVRAMGRIGATFPNVWLNMCWTHTMSPTMAASGLDEWLDQVATNKIIAFGGDVRWPVEKVYGHLVLAREVVATVLGRRVDRGLMTRDQAMCLARRWFYDNPRELYGKGAKPA